MKLSRSQKKFLKKNLKKLTLAEIAQKLGIAENQLQEYLKSIWSKKKYQKFISHPRGGGAPPRQTRQGRHLGGETWLVLVFLAFLVFAVYFNSLNHEFVSDDIPAILKNKNLGNFFTLVKEQPLNFLRYCFYFLAFKIGGRNPLFFRLFDVFFHLGAVWLIYALLMLLHSSFLAFTAASLFAVHPIQSEAVVWISGGTHVQYTFFVLLSFFFYLKGKGGNRGERRYYFASLASFFCALLTTEKSAILPLLIFAFEFSEARLWQNLRRILPFFVMSALCFAIVFFGGFFRQRAAILRAEFFHEGGLYNPLEQVPVALGSYFRLIFWPDKLTIYHSEMSLNFLQYLSKLLPTLLYFGILVYTFFKKRNHKYFFWLSFFLISLLPMLTPFKVGWIVAERYVYLGILGIFVVFGFLLEKLGETLRNPSIIYALLGILLLALSLRTIVRNNDWQSNDTLWLAAAKTSPSSAQNHNNLGDLYARQGDLPRAAEEFKISIALQPDYGDAYHNLGNTYQQMGKLEEAIENFHKALEIKPRLWQSHQSLAAIYFDQGNLSFALEELNRAVKINPENSELYTNLGVVYLKLGEKEKAQEFFQKALQLDPGNQRAKQLLNL